MAGLNDRAGGDSLAMPSLGSVVGGSSNRELMAAARMSLFGNWVLAIFGWVLFGALVFSFQFFVLSSALFYGATTSNSAQDFMMKCGAMNPAMLCVQCLISGAVTVGFAAFFLGIVQEGAARPEKLFVGFQRYGKSLGVSFFLVLFIFLWSLLLFIPGVIKGFSYAMAFFIVADDEECGPLEAITRSKEMMKGRKWKFFCLHWRFLGWALLGIPTLGLGYLWLVPYIQTSLAQFYEDAR